MTLHVDSRSGSDAKLKLFRERFSGLQDVYGTYNPNSGRAWQVKQPVTDAVLKAHLTGKQPYGVYLLTGSRTRAVVADFDHADLKPPMDFIAAAKHYGCPCYIEISKSKGFHVWGFMESNGVEARKARALFRHILEELDMPHTEVFPKQDYIEPGSSSYGCFIHAPLFGKLATKGRTVFLNTDDGSLRPHADQWAFLSSVELIDESRFDDIIEINDVPVDGEIVFLPNRSLGVFQASHALPPCARLMLEEGVVENQRVSCFRLAVQLRKVGLPCDLAEAVLLRWARKNRPINGKRIITEAEVQAQTTSAYSNTYHGSGCEEEAVRPFCDPSCPIHRSSDIERVSVGRRVGHSQRERHT